MQNIQADVAVIGGGITGLSTAWHLRRRGVGSVALIERTGLGSGMTSIQPGGLRRQWSSAVNLRLAGEAMAFYRELPDRLGVAVDPGFQACGYLFLAHGERGHTALAANVALQNEHGVPSRLVTPEEAAAIAPGLNAHAIVAAAYSPEDGYFDRPQAAVSAFAEACVRDGVRVVHGGVVELRARGWAWELSLADGSGLAVGAVVVAAAYDSGALLEPLGVGLPIRKEPRYLFYSDPIRERLLEPLVVSPELHLAAKHLGDGSVLASDLAAGSEPGEGEAEWRERLRRGLDTILPILRYVTFPVLVEGFYDLTPDGLPAVGRVPGHDGLWIAAGHSGRGFMMAPAIGRLLADAIAGAGLDELLAALAPERFSHAELSPELQIV